MQKICMKNTCLNILSIHHLFCSLINEMTFSLQIDIKIGNNVIINISIYYNRKSVIININEGYDITKKLGKTIKQHHKKLGLKNYFHIQVHQEKIYSFIFYDNDKLVEKNNILFLNFNTLYLYLTKEY